MLNSTTLAANVILNHCHDILHLSYEIGGHNKTTAVRNLIDAVRGLSTTQVIGLTRVLRRREEKIEIADDGYLNIKCNGLPYALFLLNHLRRVYKKILSANSANLVNLKSVDVIHAHKLTFEGYIGYLLAQQFGCSLMISLRQTDTYVLKYRPDLISLMKKILKFSKIIFYIMPYMITDLESLFGSRFVAMEVKPKLIFLPNIIYRKAQISGGHNHSMRYFFTAFHMKTRKSVKNKNVKNLFKAMKSIVDIDYKLHIAGAGRYLKVLKKWAGNYDISHKLYFLGAVPNSEIDQHYAKAAAFVLPSYRETFGMVYAEALMNGTPILYSKGTGFDGLFKNVGVAIYPNSADSIADGLRDLIRNNSFYRANIENLYRTDAFRIFSPQYAKDMYSQVLAELA